MLLLTCIYNWGFILLMATNSLLFDEHVLIVNIFMNGIPDLPVFT